MSSICKYITAQEVKIISLTQAIRKAAGTQEEGTVSFLSYAILRFTPPLFLHSAYKVIPTSSYFREHKYPNPNRKH